MVAHIQCLPVVEVVVAAAVVVGYFRTNPHLRKERWFEVAVDFVQVLSQTHQRPVQQVA